MQVDSIAANTFNGHIKFDKKIPKKKLKTLNEVLDFKINQKSLRERIKKASYDLEIFNNGSKKSIHPKALIVTSFKTLYNPDGYLYRTKLYLNKTSEENAIILNKFLDKFELYKKNHYYSYNSLGEKISTYFQKLFGMK
ncbi:MAG: hypothetical protein E7Z92_01285 [Cyanobacteria bacterium SIG31]|nr:hypothetical protein [Cyanobacteria bacterium SIG31]